MPPPCGSASEASTYNGFICLIIRYRIVIVLLLFRNILYNKFIQCTAE